MEPQEYTAGHDAYYESGIAARNPHTHGSGAWTAWECGYESALRYDCGERCRHQPIPKP